MERRTNENRLFELDVIRMASAILIVVYHFPFSLFLPEPFQTVDILHATVNGSWGMTPVYCFFMVSGAALMHRYEKEEHLDCKTFYKKRFLSIYPLFWITYVIGFFAVYWQLGHLYEVPSAALIWSVLGIDGWMVNWVPTFYMVGEWFLGSIIMLYLMFPAVRFFWKKSQGLTMMFSFLAAVLLFWYHPFPMDIKQNPVVDLFYFLLGAWVAGKAKRFFTTPLFWPVSFGVLVVWFFFPVTSGLPAMELTVSAQASGLGMFLRQSFILLCTLMVYLLLMRASKWVSKVKPLKTVVLAVSRKSYGIFLTHHLVSQMICGHFDGNTAGRREILAMLVLVFLATWAATLLVYRIESYIKDKI